MAAEILQFQRSWRRWLDGARIGLGATCLAAQISANGPQPSGVTLVCAAFTVYAGAVPFLRGRNDSPAASLLCLFTDAVFFLVFSAYGADQSAWVSSAFYCYLLLAAVIGHNWADVFIIVGVCIAFFGLTPGHGSEMLRRVVLFAGVLACGLSFQKRKLQERLDDAARNETALKDDAARAGASERLRIAADFHDGPLQTVISIQIRLEVLKHLLDRDRAEGMKELDELRQISKSVVADLRSFLRTMRPPPLEGTDLGASLRRVVEEFQKDTGMPVRFENAEPELSAPGATCAEVVQILREALANVQKHARAGRIAVSVDRTGKDLRIQVNDNGSGFPFSGAFSLDELELLRLGPQSIERRVRSLGGDMVVESRPGHGAGLTIHVPA